NGLAKLVPTLTKPPVGAAVGVRVGQAPMERFEMSDQSRPPEARPSEAGLNRHLGVLVGFDGSDLAALAVGSGAVEAERRNTTLTVVTAYALPTMIYPNMASMPSEKAKREAESTLAEAAELLRDHPGETSFRTESV